jgi:hypothetical protein
MNIKDLDLQKELEADSAKSAASGASAPSSLKNLNLQQELENFNPKANPPLKSTFGTKAMSHVMSAVRDVQDLRRSVERGLTGDFRDEIIAAKKTIENLPTKLDPEAKGIVDNLNAYIDSVEDKYRGYRDEERQQNRVVERRSPILNTTGQITGAVAPALLTGGGSLLPRLGGYAAQGAFRGLGESEAELTKGFTGSDFGGAIRDTAGGALAGLGFGAAGETAGAVLKPFLKALMPTYSNIYKMIGKTEQEVDDLERAAMSNNPKIAAAAEAEKARLMKLLEPLIEKGKGIAGEATAGAEKGIRAIGGMTRTAGAAAGTAIGAGLAGPTGAAAGSYIGDKAGRVAGQKARQYLQNKLDTNTLKGATVKDIDSEAMVRALNAVKDKTPAVFGKTTSMLQPTPVGSFASGAASGMLGGVAGVLDNMTPRWGDAESFEELSQVVDDPKAIADQEIEAQTNEAARNKERK